MAFTFFNRFRTIRSMDHLAQQNLKLGLNHDSLKKNRS